jgi:MoaA/NifB/PqqE/SkfB family radical SAM enzyme
MKAGINLIPWVIRFRFYRSLGKPRTKPVNVTISVTNSCNSRCKTCYIWTYYNEYAKSKEGELNTEEFERIFESLGKQVVWGTLSGGEPYLRRDLSEICQLFYENCRPAIINIPTNGLLPSVIETETKNILQKCPKSIVIINLSLDGLGEKHDEIRGVPGNFNKTMETYERLRKLKIEFPCLQIGFHSVISKFNTSEIMNIYDYVKGLGCDSYITEVAEKRSELFNLNTDITPEADSYSKIIEELSSKINEDYGNSWKSVSKITQAFRLTYYKIAAEQLRLHQQVIPCFAGYASCQITPLGEVWPCCVLGYNKPMGNLRESNYDFRRVWFSTKSDEVRKYIRERNCSCPLANAHYTNILCSFKSMLNVVKVLVQ